MRWHLFCFGNEAGLRQMMRAFGHGEAIASYEHSECFTVQRAASCLRGKRYIDKTLNLCDPLFKGR